MQCRTGCSVIVLTADKILLIKRGKEPYKGYWSLPGGAQEVGETLEACALRELVEETELRASAAQFLTTRDRITYDDAGSVTHHYVLSTFLVTEFEGEAFASDDAVDLGWYSLTEMTALQVTPETPSFIAEMLRTDP